MDHGFVPTLLKRTSFQETMPGTPVHRASELYEADQFDDCLGKIMSWFEGKGIKMGHP